jgi:DNA-directed RNA polymerase specialized sigma24 family protein
MSPDGSVTYWIAQLKAGDPAHTLLFQRYFERLVHLARSKLQGARRVIADEQDVALDAFDSFFRGVKAGRFPRLADRNDLWRLLVRITECKAIDLRNYELAGKRPQWEVADLERVACPNPTEDFAVEVADECRRLLGLLRDAKLHALALLKMESYTNKEIAGRLRCAVSTVERRLRLIRGIWERDGPDEC